MGIINYKTNKTKKKTTRFRRSMQSQAEQHKRHLQKISERTTTKSGQAAKRIKVYKYSNQLSFLQRYLEERETISNIGSYEELHEELDTGNTSNIQINQEILESVPIQEQIVPSTLLK